VPVSTTQLSRWPSSWTPNTGRECPSGRGRGPSHAKWNDSTEQKDSEVDAGAGAAVDEMRTRSAPCRHTRTQKASPEQRGSEVRMSLLGSGLGKGGEGQPARSRRIHNN
jgi:hypothetical protein